MCIYKVVVAIKDTLSINDTPKIMRRIQFDRKKHSVRFAVQSFGCMKAIHIAEFEIIKCGVEFVTGVGKIPGVEELLPHMERNENYVYWIQPKGGSVEQQQACICVNGTYYTLNNKLEKAIFRNVRLTRDFKNYERLVDGTRKLVIPNRLFQEKLRTSNRVHPP